MDLGVALNVLALGGVLGYLIRGAFPATEAVRLRNAFLLAPGAQDDFSWTPDRVPANFRLERRPASDEFVAVVRGLGLDPGEDDWRKALALAAHLTEGTRDTGPILSDLHTTYRRIRAGDGYCADFVKVYLALAHAAGLVARQWGFSFDGFGGHGHTFVEVFDRRRNKWLFLDVHNNFHVLDKDGEPVGALELRGLLAGGGAPRFQPNGPGRPGFPVAAKALDYYRRGLDEWYLWGGNAVFSSDASPLVRSAYRLSGALGRVASMLLDLQPSVHVLRTEANRPRVEALARLRRRTRVGIWVAVALGVMLAIQLWPNPGTA
jgi:hypothetical protein